MIFKPSYKLPYKSELLQSLIIGCSCEIYLLQKRKVAHGFLRISQIFYVSVIMLLRFSRIIITWVRYNESSHWFSRISQIFYVCVIVLLRFARIVIRPKVLFIHGDQKVTLSCIILSVKIRGICGRRNIILLTSNSR